MTSEARSRPRARRPAPVSREEYAEFIAQIELDAIWIESAQAHGPMLQLPPNEQPELGINAEAEWESADDGFRAKHKYSVSVQPQTLGPGLIEVTFVLHFRSDARMTKAIFATFSENNLPVNTWPYLREFVQSMASRMGWPALTLPALKRGVGQPTRISPRSHAAPPRARRRPEG